MMSLLLLALAQTHRHQIRSACLPGRISRGQGFNPWQPLKQDSYSSCEHDAACLFGLSREKGFHRGLRVTRLIRADIPACPFPLAPAFAGCP